VFVLFCDFSYLIFSDFRSLRLLKILSLICAFLFSSVSVARETLSLENIASVNSEFSLSKFSSTEDEIRSLFLKLVKAAAQYSPSIQRAAAEAEAAQSDIDEASGQRLPQIDIGTRSKPASFGSGYKSDNNGQAVTLNVVTSVYDWGRISKTIESRTFLSSAASALLEAELEASAFDVTSNLVELGKQHVIVEISQAFMERMSELVTMLEGIVAVDTGRVSELTQARAKLLQAQTLRSSAVSRVRDIEINLHKMLGDYPIPQLPRSSHWTIHEPNQEIIIAAALSHPVIKKSQAEASSAELQADVVQSSSLPQLNWVVSKSTGEDSFGREQAWQTNLSITWAAFRGGSQRAAERAARQRAEASRQMTDTQIQDIENRIEVARHDARIMFERSEQYRQLTVESDKIRRAFYEQWYHLGKRSLLDVLISENDHYNNLVNEVTNRFDAYNAILRQYAASGLLTRWLRTGQ
jgi:adhesin transport system outer membrane protein